MTSRRQVLLPLVFAIGVLALAGCDSLTSFLNGPVADPLASPYKTRRVWAIVPLNNESGTMQADGVILADKLQQQLEDASNLDVLPVNRTLMVMQAMQMRSISSPSDAMALMNAMGVDGLLVGSITTYDPYDPPKLGMILELYVNPKVDAAATAPDVRQLVTATSGDSAAPVAHGESMKEPASTVSAVLDAADPRVHELLKVYANQRGATPSPQAAQLYRINMDLYSEFVSYVMSRRLLDAETRRLAPPAKKQAPVHGQDSR